MYNDMATSKLHKERLRGIIDTRNYGQWAPRNIDGEKAVVSVLYNDDIVCLVQGYEYLEDTEEFYNDIDEHEFSVDEWIKLPEWSAEDDGIAEADIVDVVLVPIETKLPEVNSVVHVLIAGTCRHELIYGAYLGDNDWHVYRDNHLHTIHTDGIIGWAKPLF